MTTERAKKRSKATKSSKQNKPFTFTVDGEKWEVTTRRVGHRDVFPLGGMMYSRSRSVVLDPYMTRRSRRDMLLHELGHLAYFKGGLDGRYSDRLEETVVEAIAGWLFVILEENPGLAEYLATGREDRL